MSSYKKGDYWYNQIVLNLSLAMASFLVCLFSYSQSWPAFGASSEWDKKHDEGTTEPKI